MQDILGILLVLGFVGTIVAISKRDTINRAFHKEKYERELDITSSYWQFLTTASAEAVMDEIESFLNLTSSSSFGFEKFFISKRTPETIAICFGFKGKPGHEEEGKVNFKTALSFGKSGDTNIGVFIFGEYLQYHGMSLHLKEMEQIIDIVTKSFKELDPYVKIKKLKRASR